MYPAEAVRRHQPASIHAWRNLGMTQTNLLITDMAILVGIFLLGLVAKLYPRYGRGDGHHK